MAKLNDVVDAQNAAVLADLVVDPLTTEHTRIQILNMLLTVGDERNFFASMFKDGTSFGACPCCGHENHWLIPEDNLNEMGWVSAQKDDRVKLATTQEDCPRWQQACIKKKINY